ncbi:hypothetical protein BV372_17400 [Nostoc sp. T09]|uniref:hypothetical protein n=1 Tax=Nostoc sp. T09 TaxID=1932621 RepID=UPI000A39DDDF|nr:hypothetical protein [Nostoc sp. T09]OUL33122.1 hypothetical protein BV372_17400 [Nostoc sp. T09]
MTNKKRNTQPDPELSRASQLAGQRLSQFIAQLQQVIPELTQTEATSLASAVLRFLPEVLLNNPIFLAQLRQQAQQIISQRK